MPVINSGKREHGAATLRRFCAASLSAAQPSLRRHFRQLQATKDKNRQNRRPPAKNRRVTDSRRKAEDAVERDVTV